MSICINSRYALDRNRYGKDCKINIKKPLLEDEFEDEDGFGDNQPRTIAVLAVPDYS